jgi:integrase
MRTSLTPTFVMKASADPGSERTIFWDEALRGFGLMVTSAGHRSFVVQYRAGGRSRRMSFKDGLSLAGARKEARAALGVVAKGRDPLAERRKADEAATHTLKSIAEGYFAREGRRLRSIEQRKAIFERLIYPRFGGRPIDSIRRSEITRLLDNIEDENGAVMADHVLAYLRRLFSWYAGRSDEFRSPIVRGMARTKGKERARKRVLSDDELRIVWDTAERKSGPFGFMVRFLLLTATRRNEVARMTRSELSDDGRTWTIPAERYKSKIDHLMPLSAAARALLVEMPVIGRRNDGYIFTTDGKRPLGGFSKFKRQFDEQVLGLLREHDSEAKPLLRWTLHDLRRTARSLMSRAGVVSDIAERCLGHVIPGVRGVYDRHEFKDEKARAFEALAEQIDRILRPRGNVVPIRAALA